MVISYQVSSIIEFRYRDLLRFIFGVVMTFKLSSDCNLDKNSSKSEE